ncbi:hypothetical protein C8R45DRAFT_173641 [Mycena sanguinolenta]|nr:hypothetical protein C8R45DRAFT_173641 [Mycena sanguinolenta]
MMEQRGRAAASRHPSRMSEGVHTSMATPYSQSWATAYSPRPPCHSVPTPRLGHSPYWVIDGTAEGLLHPCASCSVSRMMWLCRHVPPPHDITWCKVAPTHLRASSPVLSLLPLASLSHLATPSLPLCCRRFHRLARAPKRRGPTSSEYGYPPPFPKSLRSLSPALFALTDGDGQARSRKIHRHQRRLRLRLRYRLSPRPSNKRSILGLLFAVS